MASYATVELPSSFAGDLERGKRSNAARRSTPTSQVARLCGEPMISWPEEVRLFERLAQLRLESQKLEQKLSRQAKPRVIDRDRLAQLHDQADEIRNRIVTANMRLAVSNAKRFVNAQNSFDELVSEASYSLVRAVDKFDAGRGFRFSTYATRAIRNNLFHLTADRKRLKRQVFTGDEAALASAPDERADVHRVENRLGMAKASVRQILSRLDLLQRKVITSRFGLAKGDSPRTLKQIAAAMGVSRERVRQIEGRALRQMRRLVDSLQVELPDEV
jgi:RNA polymerase sigma factor (sigma-70 family)